MECHKGFERCSIDLFFGGVGSTFHFTGQILQNMGHLGSRYAWMVLLVDQLIGKPVHLLPWIL